MKTEKKVDKDGVPDTDDLITEYLKYRDIMPGYTFEEFLCETYPQKFRKLTKEEKNKKKDKPSKMEFTEKMKLLGEQDLKFKAIG